MPSPSDHHTTLNLPPASLRIRETDGRKQVFDILRRRYVALTPEEWVRQHFIHFLIQYKGYPAALLANEIPLKVGLLQKRCDSILYGKDMKASMIMEYKAPSVSISQKVFDQICRYNITLRVPYLIVSNGIQHYCCRINYEKGTYSFLADVPSYESLYSEKNSAGDGSAEP